MPMNIEVVSNFRQLMRAGLAHSGNGKMEFILLDSFRQTEHM